MKKLLKRKIPNWLSEHLPIFIFLVLAAILVGHQLDTRAIINANPTMLTCALRDWGDLLNFGYNTPCCCTWDHQPFFSLINKSLLYFFPPSKLLFRSSSALLFILSIFFTFKIAQNMKLNTFFPNSPRITHHV